MSVDAAEEQEFEADYDDIEAESENEEVVDTASVAGSIPESEVVSFNPNRRNVILSQKEKEHHSEMMQFNHLKGNPAFQNYIQELVAKEVRLKEQRTPEKQSAMSPGGKNNNVNRNIKSPSDTTLYTPALAQNSPNNNVFTLGNNMIHRKEPFNVDQISKIVENIRAQTPIRTIPLPEEEPQPGPSSRNRPESVEDQEEAELQARMGAARDKARKLVVEAEQFKTALNNPQGIFANPFFNQGNVAEDDDFLHITCHVDGQLKTKIERGEFVELEKLLPRNRGPGKEDYAQLIFKEGKPFFLNSAERERKISNVCKWEQAFCVYAAIYSDANPSHSSEIWQYVYIINKAAMSFS